MSLDALKVALQGLYELTPIAAAVQGLIEQIQEEQRQQVAGQKGRPGSTAAPDLRDGRPLTQARGEDLEYIVREKWEAIERANHPLPVPVASAPAVSPKPQTPVFTPGVKVEIQSPQANRSGALPDMSHGTNEGGEAGQVLREAQARNRRNAVAMTLILASID